jgi:hypothetical protein
MMVARNKEAGSGTVVQIVDHVLADMGDLSVVVGPLTWQPSDGTSAKRWYFTIATSDKNQEFRCDQIVVEEDSAEVDRLAVLLELVRRWPLVVHDTDDELHMARLCETLWPGERITKLRQAVEAERKSPPARS